MDTAIAAGLSRFSENRESAYASSISTDTSVGSSVWRRLQPGLTHVGQPGWKAPFGEPGVAIPPLKLVSRVAILAEEPLKRVPPISGRCLGLVEVMTPRGDTIRRLNLAGGHPSGGLLTL